MVRLLLKEELPIIKPQSFCETNVCKKVDWIHQGQTAVRVNHQGRPWEAGRIYWGAYIWEIRKQIFELCLLKRALWTYHLGVIRQWIKMPAFIFLLECLLYNECFWGEINIAYFLLSWMLWRLKTRYFSCVASLCESSQNDVGKKYCSLKVSEPWGFYMEL